MAVMTQLPFDPERAVGAEDAGPLFRQASGDPPSLETAPKPLTVTQAAELIRETFDRHVAPLRVVGEVSNLSRQRHWYFSLKDETAVLRCVAWSSSVKTFGFVPAEGDEVVATGELGFYGPQGSTNLYVSRLEPVGAGALELRFRAMCAELRGLGYFDEDRKKTLPFMPRRVAIITSASGAAVQDVLATAGQRCPAVALLLIDVRVQGDGAPAQIARAIRFADTRRDDLGIDAILVTRGGGSAEDLWAFNERVVADAAYECRLPLVAAIGHESDTTVIELVADVRAATPTQAAVLLVPSAAQLREQVGHLEHKLGAVVRAKLARERQRLLLIERFPLFRDPGSLVARASERSAGLRERLGRAVTVRLQRLGDGLESLRRQLEGVGPQRVLSRGYSYTTTPQGRLVASVDDVHSGDAIVTRVSAGEIVSSVR